MNPTGATGSVAGFETIVLSNDALRAVIIPRLGGRVWELEDRRRHRQWIWHRHDVSLAQQSPGAVYDEVWAGGWEELFPNDAPGSFEGRELFDHGEWWTAAWQPSVSVGEGTAEVRLTAQAPIAGARCTKIFRLGAEPVLQASYRIENLEDRPFWFLFKQHLPVAITPACRLRLPGGEVSQVDPSFSTLASTPGPFPWPHAGAVNLERVPPASDGSREFLYVSQLPASWCGVDDTAAGASLRFTYDGGQMPHVWLFLTYGGWRDCYTAVLEPCSNRPKDLAEAVRLGQSARLPARGTFETSVTVVLGASGEATGGQRQ